MLYARVVLGIPVEGPFDYLVPKELEKKIKPGSRAWVNFSNRRMLGYVVKLTTRTNIKRVKPLIALIDENPVLDKNMLLLTRKLSRYYCCCWGEAIETALPEDLRKGKGLSADSEIPKRIGSASKPEIILLHSLEHKDKWDFYLKNIKEASLNNLASIILLPDINAAIKAKEFISANLGIEAGLLFRKQLKELESWFKAKNGEEKVIVATRSGIFAPVKNPGLVIIDEEQDPVYKQDQVPHYHAREIALMRVELEKAKLILGSASPSLEALYLARKNKIKYLFIPKRNNLTEIKIVDYRASYRGKEQGFLSKYLSDSIASVLNSKGKSLLFLNRKGFATSSYCHNCGARLKCPRCNVNLIYHFQQDLLSCHYCNFKMVLPKICPACNSGYIKFSGQGTERVESELSRAFPQAKIKRIENAAVLPLTGADIFISTSSITKHAEYNFDLIGVLGVDNSLNRVDLRSGEKTFSILSGLMGLTDKKLVIQTSNPGHKCFQALAKKDPNIFYNEELRQRRQLKFPPYAHLCFVKLRAKNEEKVRQASSALFERLKDSAKKPIKILSLSPGEHPKLRGNFYRQILTGCPNPKKLSEYLKNSLKDFRHSGIIVTVDVDPV